MHLQRYGSKLKRYHTAIKAHCGGAHKTLSQINHHIYLLPFLLYALHFINMLCYIQAFMYLLCFSTVHIMFPLTCYVCFLFQPDLFKYQSAWSGKCFVLLSGILYCCLLVICCFLILLCLVDCCGIVLKMMSSECW